MAKFSPTKLNQTEFLTNKVINSYVFTEGALDFSPTKRNLLLANSWNFSPTSWWEVPHYLTWTKNKSQQRERENQDSQAGVDGVPVVDGVEWLEKAPPCEGEAPPLVMAPVPEDELPPANGHLRALPQRHVVKLLEHNEPHCG